MDNAQKKQERREFLKRFWKKQQVNLIVGLIVGEAVCIWLYRRWFAPATVLGYALAILIGLACFGLHLIYLYHFYRREEERLDEAKNNKRL